MERAQDWQWGSLWRRIHIHETDNPLLHPWPVDEPPDWLALVNEPQSEAELDALRRSARRGSPYGEDPWQKQMAERLGLEHTLRPPGRPRKRPPPTGPESEGGGTRPELQIEHPT